MSIALVTSFWDRPAIESITIDFYAALRDASDRDILLCAVYSAETQRSTIEHAYHQGWHLFHAPSAPLGRKLNTGLWMLAASPFVDGLTNIITCGSDDIIHPDVFEILCHEGETTPAAGFVGAFFLCTQTWSAAHFLVPPNARPRPTGAGRILSRDVLDALDWTPRSSDRAKGMDASMDDHLRSIGVSWKILPHKSVEAPIIDVKTPRNLWPFKRMVRAGATPVAPETICASLGYPWAERLYALHATSLLRPDPVLLVRAERSEPAKVGPAAYLHKRGWKCVENTAQGTSLWRKDQLVFTLDPREPYFKTWRRLTAILPPEQ